MASRGPATDAMGASRGWFLHPFGAAAVAFGVAVGHGFGGKILDEISGLYQFGARYCAPQDRRFVSPDPVFCLKQQVTDL